MEITKENLEEKLNKSEDKALMGFAEYLDQFPNPIDPQEMADLIRGEVSRRVKERKG